MLRTRWSSRRSPPRRPRTRRRAEPGRTGTRTGRRRTGHQHREQEGERQRGGRPHAEQDGADPVEPAHRALRAALLRKGDLVGVQAVTRRPDDLLGQVAEQPGGVGGPDAVRRGRRRCVVELLQHGLDDRAAECGDALRRPLGVARGRTLRCAQAPVDPEVVAHQVDRRRDQREHRDGRDDVDEDPADEVARRDRDAEHPARGEEQQRPQQPDRGEHQEDHRHAHPVRRHAEHRPAGQHRRSDRRVLQRADRGDRPRASADVLQPGHHGDGERESHQPGPPGQRRRPGRPDHGTSHPGGDRRRHKPASGSPKVAV